LTGQILLVAGLLSRYRYALIITLLVVPSAAVAASFLMNNGGTRQFTQTASDTNYNVVLTMRHPAYFLTGEQVSVNLTIKAQLSGDYTKMELRDLGVEVRYPAKINATTGVVQAWRTLSSSQLTIAHNYTGAISVSRSIPFSMVSPPANGLADSIVPSAIMAVNGFADVTLFGSAGDNTLATPVDISLLDSQTVYKAQLSTVGSTNTWLVYQLFAALFASLLYGYTIPTAATPAARSYGLELESFRVQKKTEALEQLFSSGKIGESRYKELKALYDKELAQVKTIDKTTS
jgi:hypothetical protein